MNQTSPHAILPVPGDGPGRWPGAASVPDGRRFVEGPKDAARLKIDGLDVFELTPTDEDMAVERMSEPGYERLASALRGAYRQAAFGKGKERHANAKPFHEQPMQDLIRLSGVGFATGQAAKKSSEALGFSDLDKAIAEMYGGIVYLAGAVIALENQRDKQGKSQA